jgi:hypothetical protein
MTWEEDRRRRRQAEGKALVQIRSKLKAQAKAKAKAHDEMDPIYLSRLRSTARFARRSAPTVSGGLPSLGKRR